MGTVATSEITPRLFVADWLVAENWDALHAMGITHVVSVCEIPPIVPRNIQHLHVMIVDLPFADISEHFPASTEWIRRALSVEGTKVLVHCLGGLSRSVSIVCAYLIAAKGMTAAEAILYLKDRRPVANPNPGFQVQLHQWAAMFGLHDSQDGLSDDAERSGGGGFHLPTFGLGAHHAHLGQIPSSLPGTDSGPLLQGGALSVGAVKLAHILAIARGKALGPDWAGPASVVVVAPPAIVAPGPTVPDV
ncbi:hypothetical protein HMN09_00471400 [Mycena chlorophos]|uniref:Uncharacterized protein n=1 Tax=Mycena chlorophos TaxID=658473 RepID=A0A8H6TIL3_MYCCL|nr:hypothetical protein HMN09_00471400 [Mycena chlorophos]